MVFEHNYDDFPELTNHQIAEFQFTSPHVQIEDDFYATVVKVTDGDTLRLRWGQRDFDFPIRIANIDSLELSEGGEEAKEWVKSQLLDQEVHIWIDRYNRVGKYGRIIGEVLHNGLPLGSSELSLGYAQVFGRKDDGQIPPLDKYLDFT